MYRMIYILTIFLLFGCTGEKREKSSKQPSELKDTELLSILKKSENKDLTPYWLEVEKREMIGIRFIAQDKSGAIFRFFKDDTVSDEVVKRYILFKLQDTSNLRYAEKSVLFSQAGKYQLMEAVPLIFKALEGEKSIGTHISAAFAFKELRAQAAKEWLQKNLDKEYLNSLGSGSPFDESKREELLKISKETLEVLE